MKLVIVRHGQTNANVINNSGTRLYTGTLNNELANLTDDGRVSAIKLSEYKEIKEIQKVYCSDLKRAIDTAKLAKPGFELVIDKNLRERCLGIFEGLTEEDLLKSKEFNKYVLDEKFNKFKTDFIQKAPKGENYEDVSLRTKKFLDSLNFDEDITIGIFAHLHSIRCLLLNLFNITPKEKVFNLQINNCKPYIIEKNNGTNAKLLSCRLEDLFN